MNFHRKYVSLLRNRNFLKLWLSQVAAQPASHILNFTLAIKIHELTNSTLMVSVLVALVSIPPILFSSWAGVIADSYNRKYILVLCNFFRSFLVIGIFLFADSYLLILILAFLISIISQFFGPAEVASIPTLAGKENGKLFLANTLFSLTSYASFLLGFSLAGPFLYFLGEGKTLGTVMTLFLLATFFDYLLPPLDEHLKRLEHPRLSLLKNYILIWERLKEGISFIRHHKFIMFILFQVAFIFSIERAFISLVPSFAEKMLNFSVKDISFFLVIPTGIGALIGAVLANKFKYRISKYKLINLGITVDAICLILLSFYQSLRNLITNYDLVIGVGTIMISYVVFLAVFSAIADPFVFISAQTFLQESTPPQVRGRIFGSLTTLMNIFGILPIVMIGFLGSFISLNIIIFALGLLAFGVIFASLLFYRKNPVRSENIPET